MDFNGGALNGVAAVFLRANVMTIVVEDGTGVADANSYVTIDDLRDYAEARGMNFDEDQAEVSLIKAMDYIETRAFNGLPVHDLAWPRSGVYVEGRRYSDTMIPRNIKLAQMAAAMVEMQGVPLLPTIQANARGAIRERKVGPITTVYAVARDSGSLPRVPLVDAYLAPYEGGGGHLRVIRA